MSTQILLLYFATWSLVALSPGPAVVCAMTQATRFGFRASLAGIGGVQVGNLLFFVGVAFGLGTLLATATTAFNILRVVGAVYLFYLGVRIIISTFRRKVPPAFPSAPVAAAHGGLFFQGLLVQLTNPKALLFVSALLPQFIDPQRQLVWQLVILAAVTVVIDSTVLSSYAFLAERGIRSFRASHFSIWLERTFGATMVFFGLRLLLSRK